MLQKHARAKQARIAKQEALNRTTTFLRNDTKINIKQKRDSSSDYMSDNDERMGEI